VPFFDDLSWWDAIKTCRYLKYHRVTGAVRDAAGLLGREHWLMVEGEVGFEMQVVVEGTVVVEQAGAEVGRLRAYGFFGELAVPAALPPALRCCLIPLPALRRCLLPSPR
jgi:hypothetical protein